MKEKTNSTIQISVRTRLISVFLISVLTTIILFGIIMLYSSSKKLENESLNTYSQMTNQIGAVFSEYISRIDQTTRSVDNTATIPRYLRSETILTEQNNDARHLLEQNALKVLEQLSETNDGVYSLSVLTLNGAKLSYANQKFNRSNSDFSNPYYKPLIESTGNTILLPANYSNYLFSPQEAIFSVASKHLDIAVGDDVGISGYTGYVIAECPIEQLSYFCSNVDMGTGSSQFILDQNGNIVFTNESNNEFTSKTSKLFNNGISQGIIKLESSKYILVSSPLPDHGWTVLAIIPYKNLNSRLNNLKNTFLILCLVSILVITGVSIIVSGSFTNPIRILQRAMKKAGNGDLSVYINHQRTDEFGELNDGFNKLIGEIRVLINSIADSQERETIAKYQMLQSQINPHFLYNTLDTIRMMAVLDDKDDIANALLHLAALFRYYVNESSKLVTISEELEQSNNYLYLQKLRLQENLEVIYNIDNSIIDFKIPRLMIQPLLENAFEHGFYDLERTAVLTISIQKTDHLINFSVHDNGQGMSKKNLQVLKDQLSKEFDESKKKIGLANVNERLKLYFSKQYGLNVSSQAGVGTTVSFSIPMLKKSTSLFRYNFQTDELMKRGYEND